jgi:sugar O-acyltransferase (sialic acid O-acetyltransferase NeuD family)
VTPLVVFGSAGQAKVVVEAIEAAGVHRILGFVTESGLAFASPHAVLGRDDDLSALWARLGPFDGFVAVGEGAIRRAIVERCATLVPALRFPAVVHPAARLARGAVVEDGAFVAIGATVCADARIGSHALVNTNASIDHDCVIGAYASIAPNVALGGTVRVGTGAFIGIGASVLPNLTIGDDAIVGAGAAVIRDVAARTTVVGVPARPVR